nr:transposase [Bradyrhizobium sp. NBAIM01]
MVATKAVDFRKGMEGLATLVRESMAADPFSGAVYVFRAKRVSVCRPRELSALLEGLDLRRVHEARETPAPAQPG